MSDEVPTRKETPEVDSTDRVARLGRHAFDKSGNLKSFSDQLTAYALGETPNNEYLILSEDSSAFGLPTDPSLPMIISQANIRKISFDHEISLGMLANLDEWLKNHPLSMDSITRPDALVVFAGAKDGKDNEIVIALSIERQSGQKGFEVSVDEVASVYGKRDLDFFIGNTARLGKRLFVNERTKDWLSRTGVQFPELATSPVYSEYTLSRVKSLDEVKAPTDPNAVRKVSSLTEAINLVGDEEFSKIVYGCVENPPAASTTTRRQGSSRSTSTCTLTITSSTPCSRSFAPTSRTCTGDMRAATYKMARSFASRPSTGSKARSWTLATTITATAPRRPLTRSATSSLRRRGPGARG